MKKLILCASVALLTAISYECVTATESSNGVINLKATQPDSVFSIGGYIKGVYNRIDFAGKLLDYNVFEKAYYGYLNLRNAGKLSTDKNILTICDMSKSSASYRLWVIDLASQKLLINDYVAHGQGSGDEFATAFSNNPNSHQSSLGFYVTAETYVGKHGNSLRMHGMDDGFNSAAYNRDVVVHGASYVCDAFVSGQKKLGRSWGCPAVSEKIASSLINLIKGGTCLFVYSPVQQYLQASHWLNTTPQIQPQQIAANDFLDSSLAKNQL